MQRAEALGLHGGVHDDDDDDALLTVHVRPPPGRAVATMSVPSAPLMYACSRLGMAPMLCTHRHADADAKRSAAAGAWPSSIAVAYEAVKQSPAPMHARMQKAAGNKRWGPGGRRYVYVCARVTSKRTAEPRQAPPAPREGR